MNKPETTHAEQGATVISKQGSHVGQLLEALRQIERGLANTGSDPFQWMTRIRKPDAWRIAHEAIAKAPPRISIHVMGGREIAQNIYCADGVNARNQWGWIVDHVKEHFGCDEDDVECIETGEGDDMIAVCGKIVAYCEIEREAL